MINFMAGGVSGAVAKTVSRRCAVSAIPLIMEWLMGFDRLNLYVSREFCYFVRPPLPLSVSSF